MSPQQPPFRVVTGRDVEQLLRGRHHEVMEVIGAAYELHAAGQSVNPDSYFLRFPDKPDARIIALPAYLGGAVDMAGLKWIASFPGNVEENLQRASAVLVLNDYRTGYPRALLESSLISAHRTAASAALAARALSPVGTQVGKIAVIGAGVIARHTIDYLFADGWRAGRLVVHDRCASDAERFAAWASVYDAGHICVAASIDDACDDTDLIVIATTASEPHLCDHALFAHAPTVLNISLRDIGVAQILAAQNVFDDVEHCLKARTSPHLAELATGGRAFVSGTLQDVAAGRVVPDPRRARIFSPFGLGVLDIALGDFVLKSADEAGVSIAIERFFADTVRW